MTKQENEERLARLKNIVLSMPEKPGSYQYYDENHTIIYVGKAKNLKRRVSSYFHKEVESKIQCPAERRQDIPLYMRNKRVFSTHFQDSSYQ